MKQWDLRGVTDGARVLPFPTRVSSTDVMRSLLDQVPGVLWTTDVDLRFTSCVGAGLGDLGLGPNQFAGVSLYDAFDADDDEEEAIDAHRAALDGATISTAISWGGRTLDARLAPLHDGGGDVIGVVGLGFPLRRPASHPRAG